MIWYRKPPHATPHALFADISRNPDAAYERFHDFYQRLLPNFLKKYPENLDHHHLNSVRERLLELEAYIRYAMAAVRFRKEDLHTDAYEPLRHLYTCVQETQIRIEELSHLHKKISQLTWYDSHDNKRHMKTHRGSKALGDKELEEASRASSAFNTLLLHLHDDEATIHKAVAVYEAFRLEHHVHEHMNTTSPEQLAYHQITL